MNSLKESLKIAGEIMLKSTLKWVLIVFLGSFFTLLSFLVALFWNLDLVIGQEHKFASFFYGLLEENIPAFLLVFGAPIFFIVYVVMAQKVTIKNTTYLLMRSKAGDYVTQVLVSAVERMSNKNQWSANLMNKAALKMQVLREIKDDPNASGVQRSIIRYGFRKIDLEDVDFKNGQNLSEKLVDKFKLFFEEMMKPTLMYFWILLLVQFILLISSLFLR